MIDSVFRGLKCFLMGFVTCLLLIISNTTAAHSQAFVEFQAAGRIQQGLRLLEVSQETVILGRDGRMHSIDAGNPRYRVREIDGKYSPIETPQLRNQLQAEFGRQFDVVATKNFLVVQPRGRGNQWPTLFEQSHRGFQSYLSRRGVKVRSGRFPMVAVVMPDEPAMYREFKKYGIEMTRVAGVYAGESNRVICHDGGRSDYIRATVRHEAAHQSAFNSGVHSRLTETPKWISEGIGQMFEPTGMTNGRTALTLSDRINRDSMAKILQAYPGRSNQDFAQRVQELIGHDGLFDNPKSVNDAYAISWAVMFYLAEREPKKFAALLSLTGNKPPFREYPPGNRIADVQKTTGYNGYELGKKARWFVEAIK